MPTEISDSLTQAGMRLGLAAGRAAYPAKVADATPDWLAVKHAVDRLGIRDTDIVSSFEFGTSQNGTGLVRKELNEDGSFSILEIMRSEVR
jgi:hypothetical protein